MISFSPWTKSFLLSATLGRPNNGSTPRSTMKPITSPLLAVRPTRRLAALVASNSVRCAAQRQHRSQATHNGPASSNTPNSKRRSVTPFNDNGHVPWNQLSMAEKTARATQQTFNFGFVILGVVLTVRFLGGFGQTTGKKEEEERRTGWTGTPRTDRARVLSGISCGQMSLPRIAKPTTSTGPLTGSRRIPGVSRF